MNRNRSIYRTIKSVLFTTAALCFVATAGYAQTGTGETKGVSHQQLNPELVNIEGTVEKVESGPCKYTIGKSVSGTHLFVRTQDKLINVHLGPTSEISKLLSAKEGDLLAMIVFRTDRLPEDQYIAKEVTINGEGIVLRDDTLKPVWSGRYSKAKWRIGS
jgi:hypothetical protein